MLEGIGLTVVEVVYFAQTFINQVINNVDYKGLTGLECVKSTMFIDQVPRIN